MVNGAVDLREVAPRLDTADVTSQVIDSLWGFSTLRTEWDSLLRDTISASLFLTWEWLQTW